MPSTRKFRPRVLTVQYTFATAHLKNSKSPSLADKPALLCNATQDKSPEAMASRKEDLPDMTCKAVAPGHSSPRRICGITDAKRALTRGHWSNVQCLLFSHQVSQCSGPSDGFHSPAAHAQPAVTLTADYSGICSSLLTDNCIPEPPRTYLQSSQSTWLPAILRLPSWIESRGSRQDEVFTSTGKASPRVNAVP